MNDESNPPDWVIDMEVDLMREREWERREALVGHPLADYAEWAEWLRQHGGEQ